MLRKLAIPAATAVLLLLLGMVIIFDPKGHLDVTLEVVSVADPYELDVVTKIDLRLENNTSYTIEPRFTVQWATYPVYWRIVSGPSELAAKERANYEIETPAASAIPPKGAVFVVRVNDSASIVNTASDPVPPRKSEALLVNPRFELWNKSYSGRESVLNPYGWQVYDRLGDDDAGAVTEAEPDQEALLKLAQGGAEDPFIWAQTGLIQVVPFPLGSLDVRVKAASPYETTNAGWPTAAFGVEFSDGTNPLVWVVFQPGDAEDASYELPNGHHIEVVSVPKDEWTTRTVDLSAIYEKLGWETPDTVLINLFVAAASDERRQLSGYFGEVRPTYKITPSTASR